MTAHDVSHLPSSDELLVDAVGTTVVVTLNRPHRLNALTSALMTQLRNLWAAVAAESWVRAVVVTGADRAFCAGADMEMLAEDRTDVGATARDELSFVPGRHLDVPIIVAVNGTCAGGGLHFVADADICIASDRARFVDPHVTVGQVSGLEPLELMMIARRDVVVRMALLGAGEVLDAEAALRAGLVSEIVAHDALLEAATALGERIAAGSPEAVRVTRALIRDFDDDLLTAHLDAGWQAVQDHWQHPDAKEGPAAFTQRRRARWAEPRRQM